MVASAMATGSHEPDWQACTQDALGSLAATAAGADLVTGAGTLGAGAAFSAQELVMDAEIFSWNAAIAAGIRSTTRPSPPTRSPRSASAATTSASDTRGGT